MKTGELVNTVTKEKSIKIIKRIPVLRKAKWSPSSFIFSNKRWSPLSSYITSALKALCSVKEEDFGVTSMKVELSLHLLKGLFSLIIQRDNFSFSSSKELFSRRHRYDLLFTCDFDLCSLTSSRLVWFLLCTVRFLLTFGQLHIFYNVAFVQHCSRLWIPVLVWLCRLST